MPAKPRSPRGMPSGSPRRNGAWPPTRTRSLPDCSPCRRSTPACATASWSPCASSPNGAGPCSTGRRGAWNPSGCWSPAKAPLRNAQRRSSERLFHAYPNPRAPTYAGCASCRPAARTIFSPLAPPSALTAFRLCYIQISRQLATVRSPRSVVGASMQPLHPPTRHFRAALWVLCASALLLQLGLHSGALQDGWSHAQLDWLIRQRDQRQTANPNLVIIDIDDTSLQVLSEEAGKWPWPRSLHAELLEYLLPQQPKAVVFDLLFSEPDRYRPDADAYLAEVLGQSERVYLAALEQQPAEQSLAPLLSSYPAQTGLTRGAQADPEQRGLLLLPQALPPALWRLGSINFRADPDGVGRRYELYRSFGDWRLPSLPARVARDLGATLPEGSSFLLDWPSASRLPYPRITYAAALAQARGQVQTVAPHFYPP